MINTQGSTSYFTMLSHFSIVWFLCNFIFPWVTCWGCWGEWEVCVGRQRRMKVTAISASTMGKGLTSPPAGEDTCVSGYWCFPQTRVEPFINILTCRLKNSQAWPWLSFKKIFFKGSEAFLYLQEINRGFFFYCGMKMKLIAAPSPSSPNSPFLEKENG